MPTPPPPPASPAAPAPHDGVGRPSARAVDGPRWVRRALVALLTLIGLNAVVAGYLFARRPDGSALGIPHDWLAGTPFADYRIPGLILFALGVLHLYAAFAAYRRHAASWFWAGLCGGSMVVWIAVQAALMGSTRHPMQTILQATVLAIGLATGLLALAQLRARTAGSPARSPRDGRPA